MRKPLWTVPAMAEYLCVTEDTIRQWLRAGKIAHVRLPDGQYRVRDEHFSLFLTERMKSTRKVGDIERARPRGRASAVANTTAGVVPVLEGANEQAV